MADKPLQPTEEMIEAGIDELWDILPCTMDQLQYETADKEEFNALLSNVVCFVWQAMYGKAPKEDEAA